MAFTVSDYQDLLTLLREHPEWRAELRQEILDEEFLRLPEYIRQNSADIRQNSADIRQNSADIRALTEVVAQNSADIRELKEVVAQNSAAIGKLTDSLERNIIRTDYAIGSALETRYRIHAGGKFGLPVRGARTIDPFDLPLFAAADEAEKISEEESVAVRALDVLVTGWQRRDEQRVDVLLAVEVSVVIDGRDVDRAADRAEILRRVGYVNTIPVVAGAVIVPDAQMRAEKRDVRVLLERDPLVAPLIR